MATDLDISIKHTREAIQHRKRIMGSLQRTSAGYEKRLAELSEQESSTSRGLENLESRLRQQLRLKDRIARGEVPA